MSSSRPQPAPDKDVWWNGLRWVEAAHMQVARFEEAFFEEVNALTDADTRHRLNDDSDLSRSWRASTDANHPPYDLQRPLRVPSWSLHMQVATELDLLSVAIRNVLRAQARIPEQHRPEMGGQNVLELIRNVSEHWDEEGGRSASALAKDHPKASDGDLPPLAELVASEPFWRFPAGTAGREGVAHLRVSAATADPAGHLAVVTETGRGALVTKSADQIRAGLARWYRPYLVLLEDLGRGTGRLIIPARPVPSVRFAVLSAQPARAEAGTVSLVMRSALII